MKKIETYSHQATPTRNNLELKVFERFLCYFCWRGAKFLISILLKEEPGAKSYL